MAGTVSFLGAGDVRGCVVKLMFARDVGMVWMRQSPKGIRKICGMKLSGCAKCSYSTTTETHIYDNVFRNVSLRFLTSANLNCSLVHTSADASQTTPDRYYLAAHIQDSAI